MKKFKFHLETILKLRTLTLDEKIRALSEIVSLVNSYKTAITENEAEIEKSRKKLSDTLKEGVDLAMFRSFDAYIKRLYTENDDFLVKIEDLEPELNKAREEVYEARKHVKVLEILKEKKWKEHRKLISKLERKETEEFNIRITSVGRKDEYRENQFTASELDEEESDYDREFTKKESSELQKLYDKFT